MTDAPYGFEAGGRRFVLTSPTAMPAASTFLWNRRMLLQLNCRGFATAQFTQPEPAKYAHAPALEAKTFMQPEQPYYAHHPGRFCYVKDEEDGGLFSVPHEPVRRTPEAFAFSVGLSDVAWRVRCAGIEVEMAVVLPVDDVAELWTLRVRNRSGRRRRISLYPYFPVGYMSWMNQSGRHRADLGGIVCDSVTPYQKVEDYFRHRDFKDRTVLLYERMPDAWEANQAQFEGEGGLHAPDGIVGSERLGGGDAAYEMPTTVLQYRVALADDEVQEYRFVFAPARDDDGIRHLRARHLSAAGFAEAGTGSATHVEAGSGCLRIETPDPWLDAFANHWLPRQVFYHGDVNRLTTDPQTRNYLQDHMGMGFLRPEAARAAFLHALSQQEPSGAMPDGILLVEGAELKYINQIPHTDHCVWLPICLRAYLDETGDDAILDAMVADREGHAASVAERITRAMRWLLQARDARGLSYIAQGDWCDPMNMVGWRGRGVSGWLTLASAYALKQWADICARHGDERLADELRLGAEACNAAMNGHLWDGDWYGRGITDDGVAFGVSADREGRIFLNPQSWALLGGAADAGRQARMLDAIDTHLVSPYGVTMYDPPYTRMREDVGRVTQKFPGTAENGAVYNHAAAFYLYSLYQIGDADRAWQVLRAMLPSPAPADCLQRGQLPVFVPNYYRGAWRLYPRTAGRSSQLFNTGTAAWLYRCLVEELFGLRGDGDALRIEPHLPSHWPSARASRRFRGAMFEVAIERMPGLAQARVALDGVWQEDTAIRGFEAGRTYQVRVESTGMTARAGVVVVMGVSGSGKTTLARALADAWPATFLDADDFHSAAAKARMAGGQPLTDRMRAPWVARIVADLQRRVAGGERVVLAFSGLRRRHRDRLRASGLPLRFLFLQGDRALVAARVLARRDHYMPAALVDSQFAALEDPCNEVDVFPIPMEEAPAVQLDQALANMETFAN